MYNGNFSILYDNKNPEEKEKKKKIKFLEMSSFNIY